MRTLLAHSFTFSYIDDKTIVYLLVYLPFIAWDSLEIHKTNEYMKKNYNCDIMLFYTCPYYIFNRLNVILGSVSCFNHNIR